MSRYPPWLSGSAAAALGLSVYLLERKLYDPLHPSWPSKLGFSPVVGKAADCETPAQFIDLVMAASCVPPVLPGGRFGNEQVLDGGLINNIPVQLVKNLPGNTLLLLSRRYDRPLPNQPGVTWAQPSEPIRIDKFDYANPEGLQQTFDLGLSDGRRFVSEFPN